MSSYQINLECTLNDFLFDEDRISKIVKLILAKENINQALVNIVVVGDKLITALNKEYLKKNTTTDVISFVLENNSENRSLEGEVYANLEQIQKQAKDYNVTWQNELFRVIIHGVLHLVGYNDQTLEDKKQMTEKENYYLFII